MNQHHGHTLPVNADSQSLVRYVAFNQDSSALCVGCNCGFRLFSLNNVEKLDETYYEGNLTNAVIVERLYLSSLVVTVSQNTPRRLSLCHFKKGTEICYYSYPNRVLSVKLNRKRLVVCLIDSLYIHNIRDMKVVHNIKETPDNPRGVSALCSSDDCGYLAYPGSSTMGEVQIFDAHHLVPVVTIAAHDNPLIAMSFNRTGDKLATASDKGTVIRIFAMPEGNKLFEFRRGMKRCVTIHSLSFSNDSLLLACSSNTETIHIFKLEDASRRNSKSGSLNGSANPGTHGITSTSSAPGFDDSGSSKTWMGYFGQAIIDSASYLPSNMGEVFTQGRAAFQARIPMPTLMEDPGFFNVCALTWISKILRLVVASTSGYLYIFNVDSTDPSGDCVLIRQHKIDGSTGLGVGGSCKSSSSGSNRNSPITKTNSLQRNSSSSGMSPSSQKSSSAVRVSSSKDHTQNIVTNEDISPHNPHLSSTAIDIPKNRSFSHEGSSGDDYPGVGGTPHSFPYQALGSFGDTQMHAPSHSTSLSAPGSHNTGAVVSYAGVLGTSPNDGDETLNADKIHQQPIRLDDDSEFPPMTMHTDD